MAKVVYPAGSPGEVGWELLPQKVNLYMYAGDDFRMVVEMHDPAGETIILTGWTPRCQIKNASRTIEAVITIAPDGKTYGMFVPGDQLILGTYKYDVQFTYPDGETKTFMYGDVTVKNQVTV